MPTVSPRSITARAIVAAVAALAGSLVVRAPGAQADPVGTGVIVNSPKGFIGCVGDTPGPLPVLTYCFATQVPATGPDAGRLVLNHWVCTYQGSPLYDPHAQVFPAKALTVRRDGSFVLLAKVTGLGQVKLTGFGGGAHVPAATFNETVMFSYDQNFRLVSPMVGLTPYNDPSWGGPVLPSADGPEYTGSWVGGELQSHLVGVVWSSPTSGHWSTGLLC